MDKHSIEERTGEHQLHGDRGVVWWKIDTGGTSGNGVFMCVCVCICVCVLGMGNQGKS